MKASRRTCAFTLIEMTLSVMIFAVAMSLTIGTYLNLLRANALAQQQFGGSESLRFTLERLWKELKYASQITTPSSSEIQFRDLGCQLVTIRWNTAQKQLERVQGLTIIPLTDPRVVRIDQVVISKTDTSVTLGVSGVVNANILPAPITLQTTVAPLQAAFPHQRCALN